MSLWTPFDAAREALGLPLGEDDPAAIKRAYRQAIVAHPPDRDPARFRAARDAYELLQRPGPAARAQLLRRAPAVPPPALPEPAAEPTVELVTVLRAIATRIDPLRWRWRTRTP